MLLQEYADASLNAYVSRYPSPRQQLLHVSVKVHAPARVASSLVAAHDAPSQTILPASQRTKEKQVARATYTNQPGKPSNRIVPTRHIHK